MPEPDADLARLQRLAFGSGASDAERADAARELDALREARAAAAVEAEATAAAADRSVSGNAEAGGGDAVGEPGAGPEAAPAEATTTAPRTWLRRAIVVGVAALVVGLLAGWQLGTSMHATAESVIPTPTATPFEGPRTMEEYLAEQPLASEVPAADVFLRPATEADASPMPTDSDLGLGPLEYRLLATSQDGTRFFVARSESDFCLVVVFADAFAGSAASCTGEGRFPKDGLGLIVSSGDMAGPTVDAILDINGRLTFGTVTPGP